MPKKYNSAARQHAQAVEAAEHRFAAAVEALLRAKARVPETPASGLETWTPEATLTRLREIAGSDAVEPLSDPEE